MSEYSFHLPRPEQTKSNFIDKSLRWLLTGPDRIARFFCNENVYQEPLDGHGISYLGELISQYDILGANRRRHDEAEQAIREFRDRTKESEQLEQQIAALDSKDENRKQLEQSLKRSRITWDDLVRFESALLQVLPEKQLRRRSLSIRNEFLEVAGEVAWKKYLENKPPDLAGDIDLLRADTEELLSELHWRYTSEPVQECQRARLLFTVLCGMIYMVVGLGVVLAAVFLANLGWAKFNQVPVDSVMQFPLVVGVMFGGALGGSFSSLLRLQRAAMDGNAVVNLWKLDSLGVSAILSPFVGALSAILLLFLFTGNFVEGKLFPQVTLLNTCEKCATCTNVTEAVFSSNNVSQTAHPASVPAITNAITGTNETNDTRLISSSNAAVPVKPQPLLAEKNKEGAGKKQEESKSPWPYHFCLTSGVELAKLLIWCFIVGFSERLVPDIIDRLGEKTKTT